MNQPLNKYSSKITQPKSQGASQAMLYATGMQPEDMDKAQVGIASVWYEGNSCNMHLLDLAAEEPPVQQLSALQRELELYQPGLSQRPCLIAANKSDLPGGKERLRALRIAVDAKRNQGELPGLKTLLEGDPSVRAISAKTSSNLEPLVLQMYRMLQDVTVADRARRDALRAEATRAAEAEVEAEEERWKQQNPMAAFRARKRAMEEMEQGGGDGESEEYQFEYDEYE